MAHPGYAVGNKKLIAALAKIKSYLDYGTFLPIQVAATAALNGPQDYVEKLRGMYKTRRDVMAEGLIDGGWDNIVVPDASMFLWSADSGEIQKNRLPRIFKIIIEARRRRRCARHRLRAGRRGLCAHCAG